jgi:hypothetical protein
VKLSKLLTPFAGAEISRICLDLQAGSAKERLIYENEIIRGAQSFFYLNEGAVGLMWEVATIPHEILNSEELISKISSISKLFEIITSDNLSFQFIYVNGVEHDLKLPSHLSEPKSFSARLGLARATELFNSPRFERRLFLTLRQELDMQRLPTRESSTLKILDEALEKALVELAGIADSVEYQIGERVKLGLKRCGGRDLVQLVRKFFGNESESFRTGARLSDQIVTDFVKFGHDGVSTKAGFWEVISWADKSEAPYFGMMTEVLNPANLSSEAIFVVNIRATSDKSGLSHLVQATKNGGDAYKERQYQESLFTEERLERGEKLLPLSFQILVRNTGEARIGEKLARKLSSFIDTPMLVEKFAAFPIFMSCLPLGYSKKISGFLKREYRTLSGELPSYIPIFSGSLGDNSPSMLLHSRSKEMIWVDPRASHTNPHVAILGESGSGKSFFLCNLIVSDLSKNPNQIIFHIDNITSNEYLVKALGEDSKVRIIRPPEKYPALLRGDISPERLPTIIDILSVASELVSNRTLSSTEKVVLSEAILKGAEASKEYASVGFEKGEKESLGELREKKSRKKILKLSDVLAQVPSVCAEKELPEDIGQGLWQIFTPFIGNGPYALLFDADRFEEDSSETPLYSLYDLQGVTNDKALRTLTTLLITSEIMLEISKPQNKEKKGMLVIDELGVNLSGKSEALKDFVQSKWPVFRKLGIMCVGLTNKVEHYTDLEAPNTVWQISGNKMILPLSRESAVKAEEKKLLSNPYHLTLASTLEKRNGAFSQALYLGSSFEGTVEYRPTGFDYWPAINEAPDVAVFKKAYELTGSYQKSIMILAKTFPLGVRCLEGKHRDLTADDLNLLRRNISEQISTHDNSSQLDPSFS